MVSRARNRVVANIPLDGDDNLGGVAYDPQLDAAFLTDYSGYDYSYVNEISASDNKVTSTLTVAGNPWGRAYDPHLGDPFVLSQRFNNTGIVTASNGSVVTNLSLGDQPANAVVDPVSGLLYVTNFDQGTISVVRPRPRNASDADTPEGLWP